MVTHGTRGARHSESVQSQRHAELLVRTRLLGERLPTKRQITQQAREDAAVVHMLIASRIVAGVLKGRRVDIREEVRGWAWAQFHDRERLSRRYGPPARGWNGLEELVESHAHVLQVEHALRPLQGKVFMSLEERDKALDQALKSAGISTALSARLRADTLPGVVPKRGLRELAFRIVAAHEKRKKTTVARRFRAVPRIFKLLEAAEASEVQRLFVRECRKAYSRSGLGKDKLAFLKEKRARMAVVRRLNHRPAAQLLRALRSRYNQP